MSELFTERDRLPETNSHTETVKFVGSECIDSLGIDVIRLLDDMKNENISPSSTMYKGAYNTLDNRRLGLEISTREEMSSANIEISNGILHDNMKSDFNAPEGRWIHQMLTRKFSLSAERSTYELARTLATILGVSEGVFYEKDGELTKKDIVDSLKNLDHLQTLGMVEKVNYSINDLDVIPLYLMSRRIDLNTGYRNPETKYRHLSITAMMEFNDFSEKIDKSLIQALHFYSEQDLRTDTLSSGVQYRIEGAKSNYTKMELKSYAETSAKLNSEAHLIDLHSATKALRSHFLHSGS